jgi:hypothetical protein
MVVTLLCIQETEGWIIDPKTTYTKLGVRDFRHSLHEKARQYCKIGHDRFHILSYSSRTTVDPCDTLQHKHLKKFP